MHAAGLADDRNRPASPGRQIGTIVAGHLPQIAGGVLLALLADVRHQAGGARDDRDSAHDFDRNGDLQQQRPDRAGGVDRNLPPERLVERRFQPVERCDVAALDTGRPRRGNLRVEIGQREVGGGHHPFAPRKASITGPLYIPASPSGRCAYRESEEEGHSIPRPRRAAQQRRQMHPFSFLSE